MGNNDPKRVVKGLLCHLNINHSSQKAATRETDPKRCKMLTKSPLEPKDNRKRAMERYTDMRHRDRQWTISLKAIPEVKRFLLLRAIPRTNIEIRETVTPNFDDRSEWKTIG